MQMIRGIELDEGSREELLPGFTPEFPYIATCCILDEYMEPVVPWHWHAAVELFYIKSGCLEYDTPNGKWVFPAGSGGFVNANVLHTSKWKKAGADNIELLHLFDPVFLAGEQGSRLEQKYILPLTMAPGLEMIPLYPEDPVQAAILQDIRQAFELPEQEWGYEFALREALTRIWLKLYELARPSLTETARERAGDSQIKTLMVYIHEHYSEPISVEQLARQLPVSKRGCFRLFREQLHMTPLEYLRSYRLQQACRMLVKTREPITQIGYACGLGSGSYFGKVFREHYGCTPAQYRQKWQDRDSSERI